MADEATATPQPRPRRKGGVVTPKPLRWDRRLAATLIYGFIRGMAGTLRARFDDPANTLDTIAKEPAIFCIWHNRLALALPAYRRFVAKPHPERRLAAMVSASQDGGIVARVLEHFDARPARGSTSRRGPQALLELTSCAERGFDLAITPDGPRGPCYRVQEGVIALAQLTGLPVVPTGFRLGWKVRLKSWDRFQIPLPFSAWDTVLGPALRVPREATDAEREQWRATLEAEMMKVTRDS
ncbi:MAG TPA: lysophospholipid acyltransferase family protein [Verrucomicrobiae bacterium]|nr:lysophospholipid acyltransferase family protein [Verrucomicrobiae bacterium]